jgi:hypothetical protein
MKLGLGTDAAAYYDSAVQSINCPQRKGLDTPQLRLYRILPIQIGTDRGRMDTTIGMVTISNTSHWGAVCESLRDTNESLRGLGNNRLESRPNKSGNAGHAVMLPMNQRVPNRLSPAVRLMNH